MGKDREPTIVIRDLHHYFYCFCYFGTLIFSSSEEYFGAIYYIFGALVSVLGFRPWGWQRIYSKKMLSQKKKEDVPKDCKNIFCKNKLHVKEHQAGVKSSKYAFSPLGRFRKGRILIRCDGQAGPCQSAWQKGQRCFCRALQLVGGAWGAVSFWELCRAFLADIGKVFRLF